MRDALWTPVDGPGLEHLRLAPDGCTSVLIAAESGRPYGFTYRLAWDLRWRVRSVDARLIGDERPPLILESDGEGQWRTGPGDLLPALAGCIDVDFTASPFTNTLPIRRLGLQVGQSAELHVVYVLVPSLEVKPAIQRYTRLAPARYRYESGNFRVELQVDDDGLVLDYPGFWRRVPVA